jgi:hypothetical protein
VFHRFWERKRVDESSGSGGQLTKHRRRRVTEIDVAIMYVERIQ